MKTETITFTNEDETKITLNFDANNLLEKKQEIGLRIPAQFGELSQVILIHAHKNNYPTAISFLTQIEKFGKQQITEWLRASGNSVILPPPDIAHFWSVAFEQSGAV